jgi:hypothetical protein
VIDVDRDAKRAALLRIESLGNVESLGERVHGRAVGAVHRMQRLQRQRQFGGASVGQKLGEAVLDLSAGADNVLGGHRARPGVLRQSAGDDDQGGRAKRRGLVDIASIVVTHFLTVLV